MFRILKSCRACGGSLSRVLSLGHTPLANSLMETRDEAMSLPRFPLNLCVCDACEFMQLDIAIDEKVLFEHYLYVTPDSTTLNKHYDQLVDQLTAFVTRHVVACRVRGTLFSEMRVVEMGSNNGNFLEHIRPHVQSVIGIEPAENIAHIANERGIRTLCSFFGEDTVDALKRETGECDLFVARHCMAHLDDLTGTIRAMGKMLSQDGVAVIENAYFWSTMQGAQFDQIYHEHHSYFALRPMQRLLRKYGLVCREAYVSPIHGGALVMFITHIRDDETTEPSLWREEEQLTEKLKDFAFNVTTTLGAIRGGIGSLTERRLTIDTYGATAKGNTLLNAAGIDWRQVRYAVDSTKLKQGKFLPGSGIKVISEEDGRVERPDAYLLTAWNFAEEIMKKNAEYRARGGRFIIPIPTVRLA